MLTSVTLAPATANVTATLTCTPGATTDADGTTSFTYTYAWRVNGTLLTATTATLAAPLFTRGDVVGCSATPSDGLSTGAAVDSNTVTIGNAPPVTGMPTLSPLMATETSTLTCTPGTNTDPDGDPVTTAIAWRVNGFLVAATGPTLSGMFFSRGDVVTCAVTPSDPTMAGAPLTSASVTIANTAPTTTVPTLTPVAPTVTSTLTCTVGTSADADGDVVFTAFAWRVNGTLISATTATLTGGFTRGDVVRCDVTPTDGTSIGATMPSAAVTVQNSLPVAAAPTLTPGTATETTTLTCVPGALTDADSDPITTTTRWRVNGSLIAATTATLTGASFSRGDVVNCEVTPSDTFGAGATVQSASVTIANSPPVTGAPTVSPATAFETSSLTCTPGTSTDADGDTVTTTVAWRVNGQLVTPAVTTLTGASFNRGDVVGCEVTPFDGTAVGTVRASATITISNTAPTTGTPTLTPSTATVATTLTCAPGMSTDVDGDTVTTTFTWRVNGLVRSATTSTLAGSFVRGDVVRCDVTPSDGTTSGAAASSATLTIQNTLPVAAVPTLTPVTATEGSTLTCVLGTSTDADGDGVVNAIRWRVNGTLIAPTTATLTGTYFNRADVVRCEVTPSDGFGSGTTVQSAAVTIQNSAPTLGAASLVPATASETSTLVCTPSGGFDADGDALSYSYSWRVNGSTVLATTSTLTGTYFSRGSTVNCVITPNDGTTSGAAVSSTSVVIQNSAPTAPVLTITPASPSAGVDPLVCSVTTPATDADGDPLTYTFGWTRNGTVYLGAMNAATASTVAASATAANDSWTCLATASDGTATSSAATATTTVAGATYTIGYSTPFASPGTGSSGANYNLGEPIVVPSNVSLVRLGLILRLSSTNTARMAVYTQSGGLPGTLVAYTNAMSLTTAGNVEGDVVGGPIALAAGTYWVMVNYSGTTYAGYTTVGAASSTIAYNSLASTSPFPTSFGTALTYTGQLINHYLVVR